MNQYVFMGRIKEKLVINNKIRLHTLFDSGAVNSYITLKAAKRAGYRILKCANRKAFLGGRPVHTSNSCQVMGKLSRNTLEFLAYILPYIGHDENGNEIDLLFGALAMQKWNIRLRMKEEQIDMSLFPKEFTEYLSTSA